MKYFRRRLLREMEYRRKMIVLLKEKVKVYKYNNS